ncbi:MAG: HD domain-containing protein [Oscillospiraceae bacterium]|nr:HD domain-containing protein [Oscillospiraceae bacterium]
MINNNKKLPRQIAVVSGIIINVLLAFITYRTGLPLYFDTAGTIGVTILCGTFPGVLTAAITNLACSLFNEYSLYFAIINVLIALCTSWTMKYRTQTGKKNIFVLCALISLISGVTGTILQWFLMNDSQFSIINEAADAFTSKTGLPLFLSIMAVNVLFNSADKIISVIIALIIIHLIPTEYIRKIKDGEWMQKPLSKEAVKDIHLKTRTNSLRNKLVVTLTVAAVIPVTVMGWIGLSVNFERAKVTYIKDSQNAADYVSAYIDPEKIGELVKDGKTTDEYIRLKEIMKGIMNNSHAIDNMYVICAENGGFTCILDLDDESDAETDNSFIETFSPYLYELQFGRKAAPVEREERSGREITVFSPIEDSSDNIVGFVCADVTMKFIVEYDNDFFIRLLIILSAYFILTLCFGISFSGFSLVYPISSITRCTDSFIKSGSSQQETDENVRRIRSIDIRTGDELEDLYNAICLMESNTAEQVRAIRRYAESSARMQNGLIVTMADMVENRDSDTGAHVQKTAAYVKIILEGLQKKGYYAEKITPKYISDVVMSAPLHDVGKINISDTILNKPGKLTDEEFDVMKTHTKSGRLIMDHAISTVEGESYLKEARNMAAYHHERWDGKGYPEGLHGEAIPLSARIMAVADVFDALTSKRVYKPAYPLEKAVDIIKRGSGSQFDAKCVEVFLDALSEVKDVLKKYNDNDIKGD